MKKLIFLLAAVAFTIVNASAQQDDTHQNFQLGLKLGGNYSNVYNTQGENFVANAKVGLVAGAFARIPITELIGIQPEFLFSQKGFRATGTILGSPYSFTRTSNYLDIPIFITLKPISFISILAGPQYSYLLKQKDVFVNQSTSIPQETLIANDNIRKNMVCFIGGADLNFNHYVLSARIGWDLFKNNGDGTSITPRYKNVWYQATIGYKFFN